MQTLDHGTTGPFPTGGPRGRRSAARPGGGFAGGPARGRLCGGGFAGGGPFGGDTSTLSQAVAYARAHGGGTVAVRASPAPPRAILSSDADVAGIGGFSGRESEVTATWLADEVAAGHVRWVIAGRPAAAACPRTTAPEHGERSPR